MKRKNLALLIASPVSVIIILTIFVDLLFLSSPKEQLALCQHAKQKLNSGISLQERSQIHHIMQYKNASLTGYKKSLEQMPLLQKEIKRLMDLESSVYLPAPKSLIKRKKWITSGANSIKLEESSEGGKGVFLETSEHLSQPFQLETEDLFKLLSFIEGSIMLDEQKAPHLIITDFQISRKNVIDGWDSFQVNKLNMIKRDYSCFYTE